MLTVRFAPFAAARAWRAKGFPHYPSLSASEKHEKLRKLLDYDHSRLIRRGVVKQETRFNPLASCYFPHMWGVRAGGKRTPFELFADHAMLTKALGKRGKLRERTKREREEESDAPNIFSVFLPPAALTRSSMQKALRTYSGTQGVSAFSPVTAVAIYQKYLPEEGGVTWDMSAGWGGRLLGALVCDRVTKYIGCDPSTKTHRGLKKMRAELLRMARAMGRNVEVELHKLGSEEMRPVLEPNSVHLCFSSPPYFSTERYSEEDTQSFKKFPDQEAWLHGFIGQTLDNCAYCLKPEGVLAVNIADSEDYFKLTRRKLTRDFVALAKRKGWRRVGTLNIALSAMPGTKHKHGRHKHEPIYVFKRK